MPGQGLNPGLQAASPLPYRWLLLLGLPLIVWLMLRPRGVPVEVAAKPWSREIEIERQVLEMHSDWCAQMPAGAELLERRPRPDPERGAEAEHCRYRAPAWRALRLVRAEGLAPQPPYWPAMNLLLPGSPGAPAGERAGKRRAVQELALRDAQGRSWSCPLALPAWQAWAIGARTRLAVHRFTGVANCASLPAPG